MMLQCISPKTLLGPQARSEKGFKSAKRGWNGGHWPRRSTNPVYQPTSPNDRPIASIAAGER